VFTLYEIDCEHMNYKELDQYWVTFHGFVKTWLTFRFHDNRKLLDQMNNYQMLTGNPIPWCYYIAHIKSNVLHGDAPS
jgi:hypothetical protein